MARSRRRTWDATSCGDTAAPRMRIQASPLGAATMRNGAMRANHDTSSALTLRPMRRLVPNTVDCAFDTACRTAWVPLTISPAWVQATTDGRVRSPAGVARIRGAPRSTMAAHELVVPRSMPMMRPRLTSPPP
jgi:hypothetical protein